MTVKGLAPDADALMKLAGVAMPARDLCLITVDEPEAIARLRKRIDSFGELCYPISLVIYRVEKQGRWFEPVA